VDLLINPDLVEYLDKETTRLVNVYFSFIINLYSFDIQMTIKNRNGQYISIENTSTSSSGLSLKEPKDLYSLMIEMLNKDIFMDNRFYEKTIWKFHIFLFIHILISILISSQLTDIVKLKLDSIFNLFQFKNNIILMEIYQYSLSLFNEDYEKTDFFKDLLQFQTNSKPHFSNDIENEEICRVFEDKFLLKLKCDLIRIRKLYFFNEETIIKLTEKIGVGKENLTYILTSMFLNRCNIGYGKNDFVCFYLKKKEESYNESKYLNFCFEEIDELF
jgi:hypothetical protein